MQFQDDVVGGVTLVRPAIQSPDYKVGTSGWTINVDGSAEFNDVTIRSTLESTNYVPGSTGWKLDQNGTAEFSMITVHGNGTITGSTVQTGTSGQRLVMNPGNPTTGVPASLDMYTGVTAETLPGQIITEYVGEGQTLLSSPQIQGGPQAFMGVVGDASSARVYMIAEGVEVVVGSGTGGMVVNGDHRVNGVMTAENIVTGTYTMTGNTNDTWVTPVNVSFGVTFAHAPRVFVTPTTSPPTTAASADMQYVVSAITTTGFTAHMRRNTGAVVTFNYLAITTT